MNQQTVFQNYLLKDEEILWTGQPDTSVNFNFFDIFLVPLTFLFGAFFLVDTIISFTENFQWFFSLTDILFLCIIFYITIGRFILKKINKRHTYYAITNKRILILKTLFTKNFYSEYINTLAGINKTIRSSGIGNIAFGNNMSWWQGHYWSESILGFSMVVVPVLYDIKDAEKVYQLILSLRNSSSNSTPII